MGFTDLGVLETAAISVGVFSLLERTMAFKSVARFRATVYRVHMNIHSILGI